MDPEQPISPKRNNVFLPVLFSLVLIIGLWGGYFLSKRVTGNTEAAMPHGASNDKLSGLLDYIEYQYVDTINQKQLVEKTITAMLHSLDPHSDYIPASEFETVNEPLKGNFDGIGVEFNIIRDTIRVISPIEGGPSEKIGIKAGDKFIRVNGKLVAGTGITNKEVFEQLRGQRGTTVTVSLLRPGINKPLDFRITRDQIPLYSIDVSYMLSPDVGYIKISRFAATTYDEYLKAFNKLSKEGMKKMVLDLRGNPGGYLNAAVDIADEFLSKGLQIVYTQGKSSPKKVFKATDRGSFENNPLVILIDEGSASASEIVAGAVQDNDRGTIIGRRSFGKGLVQDQMSFPDGSAIRLTVARYYTPTGRCIQKPYTDDKEAYYNEETERYEHGELLNADSIRLDKKQKFMTPGGKTVYGGGGITPDIFVPIDTGKTTSFLNRAFYTGLVNVFAYEYTDDNRARFSSYKTAQAYIRQYEVSNEVLNDFYAFCDKQGLKAKPQDRQKNDDALRPYLKAFMGRNLFEKDAYYPIINQKDHCIRQATEFLDK